MTKNKFLFLYCTFVACTSIVMVQASEGCEDDRDWYYVIAGGDPDNEDDKRGCNAIKSEPEARCGTRFSPDDVVAKDACKLTCGTCDDVDDSTTTATALTAAASATSSSDAADSRIEWVDGINLESGGGGGDETTTQNDNGDEAQERIISEAKFASSSGVSTTTTTKTRMHQVGIISSICMTAAMIVSIVCV